MGGAERLWGGSGAVTKGSGADIVGWGGAGWNGGRGGAGIYINPGIHGWDDGAACQTPEERPWRAIQVEGKFHRFFSKLLTGDEAPKVHKIMDAAWPLGRYHRWVWGYDKRMLALQFLRGRKKGNAAVSPIVLDKNKKLQRVVKRLEELRQ
jgi:hypothetical protein